MRKNDLSYGVVRHCAVVLAALVAAGAVGAVDPVAYVREALARGEKTVTVPKGRYMIDRDDTVFFRPNVHADITDLKMNLLVEYLHEVGSDLAKSAEEMSAADVARNMQIELRNPLPSW